MMMMEFTNLLPIALLIILVYLCVYGIVNRICNCIEHGRIAKTFDSLNEINKSVKKGASENNENDCKR